MPSILELLNERKRAAATPQSRRAGVRSGIVIRTNGTRYVVNDGAQAVTCDSLVGEKLREGDRVWIGEGQGTVLILGIQGRDTNFA